jgi:hypothetical protein
MDRLALTKNVMRIIVLINSMVLITTFFACLIQEFNYVTSIFNSALDGPVTTSYFINLLYTSYIIALGTFSYYMIVKMFILLKEIDDESD